MDSGNKKASKNNKQADTTEPYPMPQRDQLSNTAFCEELLKEDGVLDEVLCGEDVEEFNLETSLVT